MPFAARQNLVFRYVVSGTGESPPIVLLNSLGADCRIWEEVAAELASRRKVLRYDLRGQGLSDSPPGPYAVADHAADLLHLLGHLGWGAAFLCGLSIGGMVAMEAAAQAPGRALGLILANTSTSIGSRGFWKTRIRQIQGHGTGPLQEAILTRWFGASYRRSQAAAARGWGNLLGQASASGYLGSCAALRDADLGLVAEGLGVPTLCIGGSEDQATPPAQVRALAARIPGAEYAEIQGAGHLAPVERPLEFAQLVAGFMEARSGR